MKKGFTRSLITYALVLVFVLSGLPMAFAAEGDVEVSVGTGAELDAALAAAVSGTTIITLTDNIDAITSATYAGYAAGSKIIINGQGYTIDGKGGQDTGLRFGARGSAVLDLEINNTGFKNLTNDDSHGGGAVALWRGNLVVNGSTFVGNSANNASARGSGGAVQNENAGGSTSIYNSTFLNNTASAAGGAINSGAPGYIYNNTIVGNTSASGGAGINVSGRTTMPEVTATNNIVIGNNGDADMANVIDNGGNITGVSLADSAAWLEGSLSANIGATETLNLIGTVDSPAIGQAIAAYAPSVDQRGVARDDAPDIGASEFDGVIETDPDPDPDPDPDANTVGLVDVGGAGFSKINVNLNASFKADKVNLVEFTIKYDASKVNLSAVIPVEGLMVQKIVPDEAKGLVKVILGVEGNKAIAFEADTTLANIVITPVAGEVPAGTYISISAGAVYAAGESVEYTMAPNAVYGRFTYQSGNDINGDGKVDAADLSFVLFNFGASSADDNWSDISGADVNGDGVVDIADVTILVDELYG